jgi:hypothetical protein
MTEAEWLASEDPVAMLRYMQEGCGVCDGTGSLGGSQSPTRTCDRCGGRQPAKPSDRKLRLFAAAAARLRPDCRLENVAWLESIRIAETVADGAPMPEDRPRTAIGTDLGPTCADAIDAARTLCSFTTALSMPEASLLRDIVGNPFRPVVLPPGPQDCDRCSGYGWVQRGKRLKCPDCRGAGKTLCPWLTPTVVSLANAVYDHRDEQTGHLDPFRLALVADALEEAGCDAVKCHDCDGSGVCMTRPRDPVRLGRGWPCKLCKATGNLPHPVLAHLRSPGPHVRGCWPIDLLTGRG